MRDVTEQMDVLTHGAAEIHPADELERKIAAVVRGERPPLRVKLGIDPTSSDLHLGHTVVLRKMAEFQRFGHTAVLIIGGFTAQVGDPSGRSKTRPRLDAGTVAAHAATYLDQARLVLESEPLEVTDNAEWLASMTLSDVLNLTSQMTVARMLERADFSERYASQTPIAVSEFLYPLLQGHDSVAVRADVELGGTDQTFNLLVGRALQQTAGQDPQCVLTTPLIEGLDGSAKMSKSLHNTIGVTDPPSEMYGKAMRLRDELIVKYLRLVTDVPRAEVDRLSAGLVDGSLHPRDVKRQLARELVALYHSADDAVAAQERFDVQFRDRGVPDDIPVVELDAPRWYLPTLLQTSALVSSGSEARRMVAQGAVRLDGEPLADATAEYDVAQLDGRVLQVGKRRFARLRAVPSTA